MSWVVLAKNMQKREHVMDVMGLWAYRRPKSKEKDGEGLRGPNGRHVMGPGCCLTDL